MYRFRKKSESRRPQVIDDILDQTPPPSSATSSFQPAPALPALATGQEFRTSLIFPDLSAHFKAAGRAPNVLESKIRSKLAQQRAYGAKEETITEEEEDLMFAALSSIQTIRRRGNSSATDTSLDMQYPESVSSSKASGPSSGSLINAFPDAPMPQETSIYPFASLSSHSSSSSPSRRHSNNLFGSSRFRDAAQMKGNHRQRNLSTSTNSQESMRAADVSASSDVDYTSDLQDVPEETPSSSSAASPIETSTDQQFSDKDKTPVAKSSRLPIPSKFPNGTPVTLAQIRRMSIALERAISTIVENDPDADEDEEKILAPHSVPLGGGYPNRRPLTAVSDPTQHIELDDLNAVLAFFAQNERARESGAVEEDEEATVVSPAPVSRMPGYVPGMARPISPRDISGHDSEDYSTTPRATSPVANGRGHRVLSPKRQTNNRPSTAPTRVGMTNTSHSVDWRHQEPETSSGLERSFSAGQQQYNRRAPEYVSNLSRMRPASPLSHNPPQTNGRTLTSSAHDASVHPSTSQQSNAVNQARGYGHDVYDRNPNQHQEASDITKGLQREKSLTRSMNGPALPDSPTIDQEAFQSYFPIPATGNWSLPPPQNPESSVSTSIAGIFMPQPSSHRAVVRTTTPVPPRSQTPNNIARSPITGITNPIDPIQRSSTPVLQRAVSPVARVGTPNYLVQRSPTSNGFNLDQDQRDSAIRRAISPRPTPSHTPSTSSMSAHNPLLHSSLGSSSRSSIDSIGSSYHSSEEGVNAKYKDVSDWLFDPESKGPVFVDPRKVKARNREDQDGSSKGDSHSKDDVSESIADQEDVLQLLTGLTKKDLSSIQQKLISAAVAREAEEAIRISQRRRRPSVQSREFVNSPTPKPAPAASSEVTAAQATPVSIASTIKRVQSPIIEASQPMTLPEHSSPVDERPKGPLIVARPPDHEDEPPVDYTATKEFEVPSPSLTPPLTQTTPAVDQSPRAKALAEALFGNEKLSPAPTPLRNQPSAEDIEDEIVKRAMAATAALKSPALSQDGNSPLRRKSTKRIDLQKISGPQLVSASMSVDAIPLASASVTSLAHGQSPLDSPKGGTKLGDRLRRLRGSLKHKPQASTHTRDASASSVIHEPSSSGLSQIVEYDPQTLQTPQIRSVPSNARGPQAQVGSKRPMNSPSVVSPPASAGPAGLKGIMARLRPKGGPRKEDGTLHPTGSNPSALLSASQLHDVESSSQSASSHLAQPVSPHFMAIGSPSEVHSSSASAHGQDEETLRRQLLRMGRNLGLDEEALNALILQAMSQKAKPTTAPDGRIDDAVHTNGDPPLTGTAISTLTRQASNRVKIEAVPRSRPAQEGTNQQGAVVRRTIIYPSASPLPPSTSPLPGQTRGNSIFRKLSSASRKRPISMQSQYSGKSVHDRIPTPPPPRHARRVSEDGLHPLPGSSYASNGRPGTSAGIVYDGASGLGRKSMDIPEGGLEQGIVEDGRALQVVEFENGEVIWSVLDTLRSPSEGLEEDYSYNHFPSRASFSSHASGADEISQNGYRNASRSVSRTESSGQTGSRFGDGSSPPETKVVYSDAREVRHLIGQLTSAAEYGSPGTDTPASAYSSDGLPVEEQLERLLQRIS